MHKIPRNYSTFAAQESQSLAIFGVTLKIAGSSQRPRPQVARFRGRNDYETLRSGVRHLAKPVFAPYQQFLIGAGCGLLFCPLVLQICPCVWRWTKGVRGTKLTHHGAIHSRFAVVSRIAFAICLQHLRSPAAILSISRDTCSDCIAKLFFGGGGVSHNYIARYVAKWGIAQLRLCEPSAKGRYRTILGEC